MVNSHTYLLVFTFQYVGCMQAWVGCLLFLKVTPVANFSFNMCLAKSYYQNVWVDPGMILGLDKTQNTILHITSRGMYLTCVLALHVDNLSLIASLSPGYRTYYKHTGNITNKQTKYILQMHPQVGTYYKHRLSSIYWMLLFANHCNQHQTHTFFLWANPPIIQDCRLQYVLNCFQNICV